MNAGGRGVALASAEGVAVGVRIMDLHLPKVLLKAAEDGFRRGSEDPAAKR